MRRHHAWSGGESGVGAGWLEEVLPLGDYQRSSGAGGY